MKQLHSIVFLLVMLGTVSQAYALGLVAGALEPTQILNNIELGAIFGEEGITSFSTAALSVNDLIAKPIISGLISSAQQQASQSILDWANGGFEGQPLIVGNPEKFIRDAGLKEVRSALSQVPTGGYGDSIFNSIVSQYKNTGDIGTQIKTLSASNIPSIIQKSVCTDATLTSLAMQDVGNSDGTYVQAELASRKNQLFNYACVGNPSTDPNVAARLTDLSKQRPNLGGWDLWLTTTGGDNSYVATQKVSQAVAVSNNNKKDLAVKDIFGGGAGAVSAKKCVRYAEVFVIYSHDFIHCIG